MTSNVVINDRVWRKLVREVEQLAAEQPHVKVGVLAGGPGVDGDLVTIAAAHEFGTATIPERSFLRLTLLGGEDQIAATMGKVARAALVGKITWRRGLDLVGAFVAAEVKKTITTGPSIPPPLKPATIERKGSSRALVDSGRLSNSITWRVEDGPR